MPPKTAKLTPKQLDEWATIRLDTSSPYLINPKTGAKIMRDKETFQNIELQYAKYQEKQNAKATLEVLQDKERPLAEDALARAMEHLSLKGDHRSVTKLGTISKSMHADLSRYGVANPRSANVFNTNETAHMFEIVFAMLNDSRVHKLNVKYAFTPGFMERLTSDLNEEVIAVRKATHQPAQKLMKKKRAPREDPKYILERIDEYLASSNSKFYKHMAVASIYEKYAKERLRIDTPEFSYSNLNRDKQHLFQQFIQYRLRKYFDILDDAAVVYGSYVEAYLRAVSYVVMTNDTSVRTMSKRGWEITEDFLP